jgi:polysaccharide export outer membrane protein
MRSCCAVLGVVLLLFGCAPGSDLPPIADYTTSSYKLGGGDQVRVIVFGEDQLTGDFKLDDQGDIALPLIGNVKGAGLTATELAGRISDELRRRHLLSDPSVAVEIASYRPVFVLGEVNKPGEYPYQPGMTMLTTVAVAGGFTYRAVEDYASVVRTTGDKAVQGRITPLSFVAPGDVIKVFERRY